MIAESGSIRSGAISLDLRSNNLERHQISVVLRGRHNRTAAELSWPDDFEVVRSEAVYNGSALVQIGEGPPFRDVVVRSPTASFEYTPEWHLKNLYHFDYAQFERSMFRQKHRVVDPETLIFSLRQILDHYRDDDGHRCVAAVVYGYRALDSLDQAFISDALSRVRDQLERTWQLPLTGHVRTDRDQIHVSLLTIRWHLELAAGDFAGVASTLADITQYVDRLKQPIAMVAYNACRAYLLRGHLLFWKDDRDGSKKVLESNYDTYLKCFQRIQKDFTFFNEMTDAHKAVAMSLTAVERMRVGKKGIVMPKVFALAVRANQPATIDFLTNRFQQMKNTIAQIDLKPVILAPKAAPERGGPLSVSGLVTKLLEMPGDLEVALPTGDRVGFDSAAGVDLRRVAHNDFDGSTSQGRYLKEAVAPADAEKEQVVVISACAHPWAG